MYRIPTLYLGDPAIPAIPCPVVQAGCHWVISEHGVATRKYDGLCLGYLPAGQSRSEHGTRPLGVYPTHYQTDADYTTGLERAWFVRETYPFGVQSAPGFMQVDADGCNVVGWRLANYTRWGELITSVTQGGQFKDGTYELVGPSVKDNPHGFDTDRVIAHRDAEVLNGVPTKFDDLVRWLIDHPEHAGVVWHHPDGRMAQMDRVAALRWQEARG